MMAPRVDLFRADPVLGRHIRRRQLRPKALADDLAFLLQRPRSSPLRPRQNLDPAATTARTTNRTSALYLADQVRGDRVHTELGSRHAHRTPEVGPAALTTRRGSAAH